MGDVKCDNGWHLTRASVIKIRIAAGLAQGRTPEERVEEVAALLQGKQKTGNDGKAEVRNLRNPNTESKTPALVPGKASCNAAPDDERCTGNDYRQTKRKDSPGRDKQANSAKSRRFDTSKPQHYETSPFSDPHEVANDLSLHASRLNLDSQHLPNKPLLDLEYANLMKANENAPKDVKERLTESFHYISQYMTNPRV